MISNAQEEGPQELTPLAAAYQEIADASAGDATAFDIREGLAKIQRQSDPMTPAGGRCAIIACDITSLGNRQRDLGAQERLRAPVMEVLTWWIRTSLIQSDDECYAQEYENGVLFLAPHLLRFEYFTEMLQTQLHYALTSYNQGLSGGDRLRLRVAFHVGEARLGELEACNEVQYAFRLLREPLFEAAHSVSGADLAAITSQQVYDRLLDSPDWEHIPGFLRRRMLRPLTFGESWDIGVGAVDVNDRTARAWIRVVDFKGKRLREAVKRQAPDTGRAGVGAGLGAPVSDLIIVPGNVAAEMKQLLVEWLEEVVRAVKELGARDTSIGQISTAGSIPDLTRLQSQMKNISDDDPRFAKIAKILPTPGRLKDLIAESVAFQAGQVDADMFLDQLVGAAA